MSGVSKRVKQHKALAALVSGRTRQQAADIADVTERTLERWFSEPEFRAELEERSRYILEAAMRRTQAASNAALDALQRNLEYPSPPSIQVRAAIALLDTALRIKETVELEERIRFLEESATIWEDTRDARRSAGSPSWLK